MAEIPEVVRQLRSRLLGARGIALADLSPAGQTGLDQVSTRPERDTVAQLSEELRPFRPRPHQRHLAAQDVPELRKLVEPKPAHDAARPRQLRIVRARPNGRS